MSEDINDPHRIRELLARLNQAEAEGAPFTQKEMKQLREILIAWSLWQSLGKIGRIGLWLVMTAAALIVSWGQIKVGWKAWLG